MDLFSKPQPPEKSALSVTQLMRRMKNLLEVQIGGVWVEGEISNLKKQGSGHWYFSLKDEGAQIQCAMFGARKRPGADVLADGAKVKVYAEASVYEARGQLQIIVQKAELAGAGDLQARFEALKRKLAAEGLFDSERKRKIPRFPRRIGIVTSASGAALQDILNVLGRRAPWVQPILLPVRVQGKGAEVEIARAIRRMGDPAAYGDPPCDVLIVGRGGGSIEDLWNFNEEVVARAIAACPIPIVSAVGHEIDFTIADFLADLRAPTPSAAAELVVADGAELLAKLAETRGRLERCLRVRLQRAAAELEFFKRGVLRKDGARLLFEPTMRLDAARERLHRVLGARVEVAASRLGDLKARHRLQQPAKVLERRAERLDDLKRRLDRAIQVRVEVQGDRLNRFRGLLRALGPESAFQRGFSITLSADGRVVRSAADVAPGQVVITKLGDGELSSVVQ